MHRLEKYLNLEGFLEKSLKIKSALKSTGKSLNILEKSLNSTIFCSTVDRDLNQYKIAVPLFGAACAAPNIGTAILYLFSSTTGPCSAVSKVSGNRCESDCRSRGREFNPGPVTYFRGD